MMKLVSLNIECNRHFEKCIPFLLSVKPDVICLQEVMEEDFEYLKSKLGMSGIFKAHAYVTKTESYYELISGKRFGVAIFSKNIKDSGYSFYWGKEDIITMDFESYGQLTEKKETYVLIWAKVIGDDGVEYLFSTTHFPVTKNGESTEHQLSVLAPFFDVMDKLGEVVLCGDFNAPRGRETFRRLSEKYYDNIPEHYETSLDQTIHRVKGLIYMVDGLFTTPKYKATNVSLVDGVSDHMAIVATINKL